MSDWITLLKLAPLWVFLLVIFYGVFANARAAKRRNRNRAKTAKQNDTHQ